MISENALSKVNIDNQMFESMKLVRFESSVVLTAIYSNGYET